MKILMGTDSFKIFYRYIAYIFAIFVLVSCGDDDVSAEPEPVPGSGNGEVSFEIINDNGTGSGTATSPVEVSKGETLNMVISQKSSYTDSDGTVFECEPKATIELFAKLDTVYVENLSQLTDVQEKPEVQTSKEGDNPVVNEINQKFLIGEQYVNFDLAYEVYNYKTVEGKTIEMPYVKLNQANLGSSNAAEETKSSSGAVVKSITIKPIPQTRASVSDTTWYEVNAVFNLDIECINSKVSKKQNLTFSVIYNGAVVTENEEEPKLVRVGYRTGYVWEEAHDNLPLLYYAKVYRDRYYSNGEVFTDEFVDNGHPVELGADTGINTEFPCEVISDVDYRNDSIWTSECVVAVDDISTFEPRVVLDENDPGIWSEYVDGKFYDNVDLEEKEYDCSENYESTTLQSGWYFQCFSHCQYMYVCFDGVPRLTLYADSGMYDQFLVIDGKIINFLAYKPVRNFSHNTEDISVDSSKYTKGKKLTNECTTYYLGRKFYTKTVLILYEKKK